MLYISYGPLHRGGGDGFDFRIIIQRIFSLFFFSSGSGHGQTRRVQGGHVQRAPVHAGVGWHGLHVGRAGRKALPGREDHGNLRGHVRNPKPSHRGQRV